MTSRVQKGGPIFRPVVKSRTRLDVRQSSVVADSSNSSHNTPASSFPPSLTSPPVVSTDTSIPSTRPPPGIDPSDVESPTQASLFNAPPPIFVHSKRSTPAPPTLLNRATPIPAITKAPPIISSSAASPPSRAAQIHDLSNRDSVYQPTSAPYPHHGVENVPTSALNIDTTPKLQRTNSREKVEAASVGSPGSTPTLTSGYHKVGKEEKRSASKKRRKKDVSDLEGSETSDVAIKKRKRRQSSSTPHPQRSRGPSLPAYDPDADPGEEIDPTIVTMASLCNDTGQGRVSRKAAEILSNHATWKSQNREKRARMKTLMELRKYGREEEAEALEANFAPSAPGEKSAGNVSHPGPSSGDSENSAIVDDTGSGFDYSQDLATSRYNVQVRIGPNGETMIDEDSLVVDRAEAEDTSNYTHVVESDHTKFVNSGSYGKRYRGSRWSAEETELFYDALAQYGENYELIAYVLPGRDRKSCKNKFKAEDKKNPARINHCLNNNIPVDMATLSRMTGKDFSGPVPEIRAPTPQPIVEPLATNGGQGQSKHDAVRKRQPKKMATEDGVVIVGDAASFVPFPDSP